MSGDHPPTKEQRPYSVPLSDMTSDSPADTEKESQSQDIESGKQTSDQETQYPTGLRFALIMISVYTSMFLVSLDRMIISTAIPEITNQFHSINDIGWYASAYLLTSSALQLLFGKIYAFFSLKFTLLTTILLFEIGSAICGAAPNSIVFIVGRAISGLGGAGILVGLLMIIVHTVPLEKRPIYQGLFGAVFGISSIIGPLLGGVFTSEVTWRWCFYINLPLGGVAMVVVLLLLKIPDRDSTKVPMKEKFAQMDFYGTVSIIGAVLCLVLALQWGGVKYSWSNGRVIAVLVVSCVLFVAFCLVQVFLPRTATLPPRIFTQRSIIAGFICSLCNGAAQTVIIYYIPIWFQAIQGVSAVQSGIRMLPMMMAMVVSTIGAGVLVKRTGYYTPFLIAGVALMSIGAGLLTTFQVDTGRPKWIGYQFLYGFGMGMVTQAPNLAAQTVLPKKDVAIGASLMFFSQQLSAGIFGSVSENIFNSQLQQRLGNIPGFDPSSIQGNGVTSLIKVPDSIKGEVLKGYNEALRHVFQIPLIVVCIGMIGALMMEWRSVKKGEVKQNESKEQTTHEKDLKVEK